MFISGHAVKGLRMNNARSNRKIVCFFGGFNFALVQLFLCLWVSSRISLQPGRVADYPAFFFLGTRLGGLAFTSSMIAFTSSMLRSAAVSCFSLGSL
jgi:uncharacterized membrane protein